MKKLIYKAKLNCLRFDYDFRAVVGIYDDGTFEFLDCSENERKKKEEAFAKAEKEPLLYWRTGFAERYNPRYSKAYDTLCHIAFVSKNPLDSFEPGGTEYFGEGEPWEPDPEMEGVLI